MQSKMCRKRRPYGMNSVTAMIEFTCRKLGCFLYKLANKYMNKAIFLFITVNYRQFSLAEQVSVSRKLQICLRVQSEVCFREFSEQQVVKFDSQNLSTTSVTFRVYRECRMFHRHHNQKSLFNEYV